MPNRVERHPHDRETDASLIGRYREARKAYFRLSKKLDMMSPGPGRDRAARMTRNLESAMAELRGEIEARGLEGMTTDA